MVENAAKSSNPELTLVFKHDEEESVADVSILDLTGSERPDVDFKVVLEAQRRELEDQEVHWKKERTPSAEWP